VLRVSKLTDAEYVLEQVAGGLEDYYLGKGEAPGVWAGALAARLGLEGVVEGDELRALIDRVDPTSGTPLAVGVKQPRVRAFDATFSAPKSVSLLHALADPATASAVGIAQVDAVAAALGFLESKAAVTRRQVAGVRRREATEGWGAATFVHRTSREGDPQLHTHAVIPNLVRRVDGSWVALDGAALYRWAKAAGSVYQEQLRRNLSEALEVGWGPDRNGCRELVGISEAQRRTFSKRTAQIEAHLAAAGEKPPDARARMQADEAASLATRRHKNSDWTPAVLAGRWADEATSVDLPVGEALTGQVLAAAATGEIPPRSLKELFGRLVDPETGVCAHDARFGEARVIEAVAAMGAGSWTATDVQAITDRFLASDLVVQLVNRDWSGRSEPRWSTVAHRAVEDRVLDNLTAISERAGAAAEVSEGELAGLGPDQADAVRTLCGPGPALRTLIAPAGHGKTATLAAAASVMTAAGRPVLAVASTNQAVEQLRSAGLSATTIARFALQGTVLEPGSVVICDEVSQLPTSEAAVLLAAVAACPDGQVWFVGDPQQAQPVGAGGLAHHLTDDPSRPRMVSAELTVNRRQADPDERAALAAYRAGHIEQSQTLRDVRGWEHSPGRAEQARRAMAAAVAADVVCHGSDKVMALAVTHADCEDIADRIRRALIEEGRIGGPVLEGPGWAAQRSYQAGDRIVMHAHLRLNDGTQLSNGTTATVITAGPDGLVISADGRRAPVTVPAPFVQGRSSAGRPQVSHAWCRTVDGVQGGTWAQVHLLATPALDNYRGYVGQSRSIQPTQTWNTIPTPDPDHGGRLVGEDGTPAEQVAAAMHKARPKTFAALDDPYRIGQRLGREIVRHRRILDQKPPDHRHELDAGRADLRRAETELARARKLLERCAAEAADSTAGLRRITPGGRARRADAEGRLAYRRYEVDVLEGRVAEHTALVAELAVSQNERDRHERANAWRTQRIAQLEQQLRDHWTDAVLGAARTGNPLAYGTSRLRSAHRRLTERACTLRSGTDAEDPRRCRAETDLTQLETAAKLAIQSREMQTRRARARATQMAFSSTAEPPHVQPEIGPDL
jgi:conjugative relaxase-like TrwC/TraI family protein